MTDTAPKGHAPVAPATVANRVVVAAATFNRPQGLKLLLDELQRLSFSGPSPDLTIAIIDNSPEGNARAQVEARQLGYRWPLVYAHEAERGIAQARNRALDVGIEVGAEWLAFIDDDEYPDPDWLDRMIAVAQQTGATAVVGSVQPDFEVRPAPWMVKGRFFAIDRFAEAQPLDFGNTSNVLFDLQFVQRHRVRFDRAFALTGGEDTLFFEDVQTCGGRIVFSLSGVVHETIVPHRSQLGWLVKRWVRSGNTDGRIVLRAQSDLRARLFTVFGGGLVRFAIGGGMCLLTSPVALAGGGHIPAEHLRVASRGFGFMMSAFNSTIQEYEVVRR